MRERRSEWFAKTFDAGRRCSHDTTRLVHDPNGDKRIVCLACSRTVMHRRAGGFR